jgi:general secretion pathway protein G
MGCASSIWVWSGIALVSLVVPAAALFFLNTSLLQKRRFLEDAAKETIKGDEMTISIGLDAYRAAAGSYPTTEQGLDALLQKPTTSPIPKRWFSILSELPRDPWKQPYKYRHPAMKSKKGYDLYSVGRDGVEGTADDIGNW